jgi:hypothetical protein
VVASRWWYQVATTRCWSQEGRETLKVLFLHRARVRHQRHQEASRRKGAREFPLGEGNCSRPYFLSTGFLTSTLRYFRTSASRQEKHHILADHTSTTPVATGFVCDIASHTLFHSSKIPLPCCIAALQDILYGSHRHIISGWLAVAVGPKMTVPSRDLSWFYSETGCENGMTEEFASSRRLRKQEGKHRSCTSFPSPGQGEYRVINTIDYPANHQVISIARSQ